MGVDVTRAHTLRGANGVVGEPRPAGSPLGVARGSRLPTASLELTAYELQTLISLHFDIFDNKFIVFCVCICYFPRVREVVKG